MAVVAVAAHLSQHHLGERYGLPLLARRYLQDPDALEQVGGLVFLGGAGWGMVGGGGRWGACLTAGSLARGCPQGTDAVEQERGGARCSCVHRLLFQACTTAAPDSIGTCLAVCSPYPWQPHPTARCPIPPAALCLPICPTAPPPLPPSAHLLPISLTGLPLCLSASLAYPSHPLPPSHLSAGV